MGSSDRSHHDNTGYHKLLGERYHKLHWNPPFPPHSGQLGPPMMYQSASNASYVKMNSAAVKVDTYNEFDEKEGSKEEPVYERVGPSQWPSEYVEPSEGHIYANT